MTGIRTEYSTLVGKRDIIFPDFQQLQKESALELYERLRADLEQARISCVIDIGCGTGEILFSLAQQIELSGHKFDNKITLVGLDVNKKSINAANKLAGKDSQRRVSLAFFCVAPDAMLLDEFEAIVRKQNRSVAYDEIAVICTGHTFFHLHYLPRLFAVLGADAGRRPKTWVIDVYDSLGKILKELPAGEHLERRSERNVLGQKVEYFLYTRQGPAGSHRLERGIYEMAGGSNGGRREVISTSQLDWSEEELERNFLLVGYSLTKKGVVDTGYGKMSRLSFTRNSSAF